MLKELHTNHGILKLPSFFPDATEGYVKALNTEDLYHAKVDGIVTNAYHLKRIGLIDKIKKQGGIQEYMKFYKPAISDSGGFQVMSLIRDNGFGEILDDKVVFELDGIKTELTPEESIRIQLDIGTDMIMCLDDCTRYTDSYSEQVKSVERTINWAKRCKNEFKRLTKGKKNKPLLFGIIQGGNNLELRKYCADELKKIGFDGYSWGGWSIDKNGKLLKGLAKFIAEQMPDDKPKYAMGIGDPRTLVESFKMGYNIFDCVVPTREGRRQRLYYFKKNPEEINSLENLDNDFYGYFSIKGRKYLNDNQKISEFCDCKCCTDYTRLDIYKFFKSKNPEALKLASMHNLRFYSMLMEILRKINK